MSRHQVAVLGGGPAGLAAAYALSAPQHEGKFEVTVYQQGWRLGGKGASGRNAAASSRIEEHGLHLWFGFYEKALELTRHVYAELGLGPVPFAPIEHLVLWQQEQTSESAGRVVRIPLPSAPVPARSPGPPHRSDHVRAIIGWIFHSFWNVKMSRLLDGVGGVTFTPDEPPAGLWEAACGVPTARDIVGPGFGNIGARVGADATTASLHRFAEELFERETSAREERENGGTPRRAPEELRTIAQLFDFFAALFDGIDEDELFTGSPPQFSDIALARLDEEDFATWLAPRLQGWKPFDAPFVRSLYELVFAFEGGKRDRPALAAGVCLRSVFRMVFEHGGALMLRMNGSMGDVIFAPLYAALKRRGVRFEFLTAVEKLHHLDGRVERIDVVKQAELAQRGEYEPLDRDGYWPNAPLLEQLMPADAERLGGVNLEHEVNPLGHETRVLERGSDFDSVVLAIPVGALKRLGICAPLAKACPTLEQAIQTSSDVATQALQIWSSAKSAEDIGIAPVPGAVTGAQHPPFDTCADMSPVLPHEAWPGSVRLAAYFCGVLDDTGLDQASAEAQVLANAEEFLAGGTSSAALLESLVKADGSPGGTVADQYLRANVTPSERYVLSLPGSIKGRVASDGSGLDNLVLAGDWTRTEINASCIEGAVESGQNAAEAIVLRQAAGRSWSSRHHGRPAPWVLFDFRQLAAGHRFDPLPESMLTAWYLPRIPWHATAEITAISDRGLRWVEQNVLLPRRRRGLFRAEVEFSSPQEDPDSLVLEIRAVVAGVPLRTPKMRYKVIGVERNLLVLLHEKSDMVSVVRQLDDVIHFHMRMPMGIAIHKVGRIR